MNASPEDDPLHPSQWNKKKESRDDDTQEAWMKYGLIVGAIFAVVFLFFWLTTQNYNARLIDFVVNNKAISVPLFLIALLFIVVTYFFLQFSRSILELDKKRGNDPLYTMILLAPGSIGILYLFLWPWLVGDGEVSGFLSGAGWALFYLFSLVALPFFVTFFIPAVPEWAAGYIAWKTKHPSTQIVQNIAAGRTEAVNAEQRLMHLLRSGDLHDEQAIELMSKMSPMKRWMWEISYRKYIKSAQSLRSTLDVASKAVDADVDLLEATHELGRKEQSVEDRERLAELRAKKEAAEAELAELERELGKKQ